MTTSKKFKAVNQNAMVQIDHALSSSERERLIKRTRVRRDGGQVVGKVEEIPLEGEKKKGDEQVFDDGDFYGQLLRDVVESRMLDLGGFQFGFCFLALPFAQLAADSSFSPSRILPLTSPTHPISSHTILQ